MTRATTSADGETIIVHLPLTFRKRGGRKRAVTPDGAEWAPRPRRQRHDQGAGPSVPVAEDAGHRRVRHYPGAGEE
jgi:hypothetical protein